MERYRVTKVIEFACGHRLLGPHGQRRFLREHDGLFEGDVDAARLDDMGTVVDFTWIREGVNARVTDDLEPMADNVARDAGLPPSEVRLWETSTSRTSCRDQARGER